MAENKFCRMVLYINPGAPLSFEMHSVPAEAARKFIEAINKGGKERVTMEFSVPTGEKIFSVKPDDVISFDTIWTESGGKSAGESKIQQPGRIVAPGRAGGKKTRH